MTDFNKQNALALAEAFNANERTSDESFLAISNRGAETLADFGAD